jgi:XapX domain-containing protein
MKLLLGFVVAFGIGAFCRLTRIPSPAQQAILGSILVVIMSIGYVVTGQVWLACKAEPLLNQRPRFLRRTNMRVIQFNQFGDPFQLHLVERPDLRWTNRLPSCRLWRHQ